MSSYAWAWAMQQQPKRTIDRLLLRILADLCDERHSCSPSDEHLMDAVGARKPALERSIQELSGLGLLYRKRFYDDETGNVFVRYYLPVDGEFMVEMDET